jgi:hypothetical protein
MKKDVAFSPLRGYTLRINQPHYHMTNTTTTAPNLKEAYTAKALETTTKTTQKEVVRYFAKEKIVCKYAYNTHTYEIGEEIGGEWRKEGLVHLDGYGCLACPVIPWEKLEEKTFVTVREYKTTTWEVVEK